VHRIAENGSLQAEIRGVLMTGMLPAYGCADEDELFCLIGSSGLLEIALKNGSAQQLLAACRGDRVTIGIGGRQSDCAPATPPGMRVRTGRFEKLRS
jgi:hypothetical protein